MSCPTCDGKLDMATATPAASDSPKPKPGDLSVCIYCATILQFKTVGPFTYHVMTKEEINGLPEDVRFTMRKTQWIIEERMRGHEKWRGKK